MYRLIIIVMMLFSTASFADEERRYFPQPVNLQKVMQKAENENLPVLMMFSSRYCDYCGYIKRDVLIPMRISGDYENKVIIAVIENDEADDIIDRHGNSVSTDKVAAHYKIQFTPTVIFVNYKGEEIANRLVGLGTEEYYASMVDEAILHARKTISASFPAIP